MFQLSELICKLFNSVNVYVNKVVEEEELKKKKFQPIDQLKVVYDSVQAKLKDYKSLEAQLQKYESEVRRHIRDDLIQKQKIEEMNGRIEELEASREELLQNTKTLINKLKRENEDLYQKARTLQQELDSQKELSLKLHSYQEKLKALEMLTQQSTKISNSKFSTLENTSLFIGNKKVTSKSRVATNVTPQRQRGELDQSFKSSTKRLSQQLNLTSYLNNAQQRKQENLANRSQSKSKYLANKRGSSYMNLNNSQSLDITKSM